MLDAAIAVQNVYKTIEKESRALKSRGNLMATTAIHKQYAKKMSATLCHQWLRQGNFGFCFVAGCWYCSAVCVYVYVRSPVVHKPLCIFQLLAFVCIFLCYQYQARDRALLFFWKSYLGRLSINLGFHLVRGWGRRSDFCCWSIPIASEHKQKEHSIYGTQFLLYSAIPARVSCMYYMYLVYVTW